MPSPGNLLYWISRSIADAWEQDQRRPWNLGDMFYGGGD